MRIFAYVARGVRTIVSFLLATAIALFLVSLLITQSETGRSLLAQLVAQQLSSQSATVSIGKLAGNLPGEMRLEDVAISDPLGEWLTLESADVTWRPLQLVWGQLHIEKIQARGLYVSRTPVSSGATPRDTVSSIARVLNQPLAVTIDRVELDDAELAAAVTGQAIAIRVTGSSALAAGGRLQAQLSVVTVRGRPGTVTLDARLDAIGKTLNLIASWREPQGGVLARALDLPWITIDLRGDGALDDWQGQLHVNGGELASVHASARLKRHGSRYQVSAEGRADAAHFVTETVNGMFADDIAFNVRATFSTLQEILVEYATLSNDLATLELAGILSSRDSDLSARLMFERPGLQWLKDQFPAVASAGLIVNTHAYGPIVQPSIAVTFHALNPSAPQLAAADLFGSLELALDRAVSDNALSVEIKGSGRLTGVHFDHPVVDNLIDNRLAWNVAARFKDNAIDIEELLLSAASARVSGKGRVGLATGSAVLDISADVPDLVRFDPGHLLIRKGRAFAEGRLATRDLRRGFSASLSGKTQGLLLTDPLAAALTGSEVSLNAELKVDSDGTLFVDDLALRGEAIKLDGDFELTEEMGAIRARYRAEMDNRSHALPLVQGIVLEGTLDGPVTDPALNGTAIFEQVQHDDLAFGSPIARYSVTNIGGDPEGFLSIALDTGDLGSIRAESRFLIDDFQQLSLTGLKVEGNNATASGDLFVPFSTRPVRGTVTGRLTDLEAFAPLARRKLRGLADFEIVLDGEGNSQSANITVMAKNVLVGSLDARQRASANTLVATANIKELFTAPRGDLTLEASNARLGEVELTSLSLAAEMTEPAHADVDLRLLGDLRGPLQIDASTTVAWPGNAVAIDVQRLQGEILGEPLQLTRPTQLSFGPERVSFDRLAVLIGGGEIRADGDIDAEQINLKVSMNGMPLALLDAARVGTPLQGELSGELALHGSRANPGGEAEVSISALQLAASMEEQVPAINGFVAGEWRSNRLSLTGEFTGFSETALSVRADIPLVLVQDPLQLTVPRAEPVSGTVLWRGEVEPLIELFVTPDHDVSGLADLTMTLTGTLEDPRVDGGLHLTNGKYENYLAGTLITNAAVRLTSDGQRIIVEGTATDGEAGRISVVGGLDLDPTRSFNVGLTLDIDNAVLVRLDELNANASGQVTLTGPLTRTLLSGRVLVNRAEARIIASGATRVVELAVVEINHPNGVPRAEDQPRSGESTAILMDLGLDMPGKVFVRGRGLDSEWAGVLQISGTVGTPIIGGELHPVRGGFSFAGKEFKLRTGSVRFSGTDDIDPVLDLPGEYTGRDITAIISVTGRASNPEIKIASRPPLPESQILSRVLFDTDAQALTAGQQIELAVALATLTGRGDGGVLDTARRALGVDTLAIRETTDGTGAKISAGKYLTDKVYLEVEQSAGQDPQTATVEFEVAPKVKLATGSKGNGDGKFGIKWRWDY